MQETTKKKSGKEVGMRTLMSLMGVIIMSLGVTLLNIGDLGLDPYTALNLGISEKLTISLGIYQLISNLVIIIAVFLLSRKMIGIGTVLNMVLIGFLVDWFSALHDSFFQLNVTYLLQGCYLLAGIVLFTLGSSLYMGAELGVAPYDAVAPIISERFHISYRICRVLQDLLFMGAAFLAGGPFGIVTIFTAFFAGPLIVFWNDHASKPLVAKIKAVSGSSSTNRVVP